MKTRSCRPDIVDKTNFFPTSHTTSGTIPASPTAKTGTEFRSILKAASEPFYLSWFDRIGTKKQNPMPEIHGSAVLASKLGLDGLSLLFSDDSPLLRTSLPPMKYSVGAPGSLTRAVLERYSFNSQEISKAGDCVREGGSLSGRDRALCKKFRWV